MLIKNHLQFGNDCFSLGSKVPRSISNKTDSKIENEIICLRNKHPNSGARKLRKLLELNFSIQYIPSDTTVNAILKRSDLNSARI